MGSQSAGMDPLVSGMWATSGSYCTGNRVTKCVAVAVVWAFLQCVRAKGPRGGETEEGDEMLAEEGVQVRGREATCARGWPVELRPVTHGSGLCV